MARNYYYLVAGLKEYSIDSDTKGFDAVAIRDEIAGELHEKDREYFRDLYLFYDISNLISFWNGKGTFNELGNLTREEMREELEQPVLLPEYIREVIVAYRSKIKEDKYADVDESIDTDVPLERTLWTRYYDRCEHSGCDFLRRWYGFDRELRNVSAAYTARLKGRTVATELVGGGDVVYQLARSSAQDFGLRNEIDYMDRLFQILDSPDMLEKERRLDQLRWEKADEFTDFDYFNINKILAYAVKINIIHRWMTLDEKTGREMFRRLIGEMTGTKILDNAVLTVGNRWDRSE